MTRKLHVLIAAASTALLFVSVTTSRTLAAPLGNVQAQELDTAIWPALFPLLAAAVAVERAIELGWSYIEWILIRFFRWKPGALKSPSYVQFKTGTSLLAGLFLGILVSNYSGMRLLGYLQPAMPSLLGVIPPEWDIILTGIVIGAGSKPAHDILGLITQLKNFTGNNALKRREEAGAALAEGILKLNQADSPYSIDVPGVGATRVSAASAARSRLADDTGKDGFTRQERLEQYADIIHNNLYIGS